MTHETMLAPTMKSGSASGNPLRVLMAYWDGGGNVPPQRALARALKRRGHDVHVLTHDSQAKSVASDGGKFHSLATARQWNPARPNTAAEEGAFIAHHLAGSSAFAGDFLATHAAVRASCQAFASRVDRFGDLPRAADLVEALVRVT